MHNKELNTDNTDLTDYRRLICRTQIIYIQKLQS